MAAPYSDSLGRGRLGLSAGGISRSCNIQRIASLASESLLKPCSTKLSRSNFPLRFSGLWHSVQYCAVKCLKSLYGAPAVAVDAASSEEHTATIRSGKSDTC